MNDYLISIRRTVVQETHFWVSAPTKDEAKAQALKEASFNTFGWDEEEELVKPAIVSVATR